MKEKTSKKLTAGKKTLCPTCKGSGWHERYGNGKLAPDCDIYSRCKQCHGLGKIQQIF